MFRTMEYGSRTVLFLLCHGKSVEKKENELLNRTRAV